MNKISWKSLPFTKAFSDVTAKASKVDQKYYLASGQYPIIDQGQKFVAGYVNNASLVWSENLPVIIFGDHTRTIKFVDFPFVLGADGTKVLKPNESLWPKYAYYALQTLQIPSAGYSRHFKYLKEKIVSFPPFTEQQRIATILEKADRLRGLRRYALDSGETYLHSVFLDMFCDPRTNPKYFEMRRFGDVFDSHLGKMLDAKQQTGKHKRYYLRNVNVQWNRLDLSDLAEMDFTTHDRKKYRLQNGDVLICEGGEVGRAAIWRDELSECYFQKALHRARPNPKLATPEFLVWLMFNLAKRGSLAGVTSEVTFAHLTGVKLKTIEFPLPPLYLQELFSSITNRFQRFRLQQTEALRQAEHLFQSLINRAFIE